MDFGTDISTFPALDSTFTVQTNWKTVVGQRIARMLMTPRGALAYAPNRGTDVRGRLNATISASEVASIRREIEAECLKDEAISSAGADVTYVQAARSLTITLALTVKDQDEPLSLVLAISAVTTALLSTG